MAKKKQPAKKTAKKPAAPKPTGTRNGITRPPAKGGESKPSPTNLTPEQFQELGSYLIRYGGNVYFVAKSKYGYDSGSEEASDALFEGLKTHANIFKCEMCDQWKDLSEREKSAISDSCSECLEGDDLDD